MPLGPYNHSVATLNERESLRACAESFVPPIALLISTFCDSSMRLVGPTPIGLPACRS